MSPSYRCIRFEAQIDLGVQRTSSELILNSSSLISVFLHLLLILEDIGLSDGL